MPLRTIAIPPPFTHHTLTWPTGLAPVPPETLADHAPDLHLITVDVSGVPVARCSLWWTATALLDNRPTGYIGHYAATSTEAARHLLDAACGRLHAQHCATALAPIDGSTWRRYRLVTDRTGDNGAGGSGGDGDRAGAERGTPEPPFFLEPDTPADHPDHLRRAGFDIAARYHSALAPSIAPVPPPRLSGIAITSLEPSRPDEALNDLYTLSCTSFTDNLLYTHLSRPAFDALYRPLLSRIDPRLVLFARDAATQVPVGFLFTLPDLLEPSRGHPPRTLILKSLAVHPAHRSRGIATALIAHALAAAPPLGLTRAIFALMHDDNASAHLSARFGARVFRRYALFAKPLIP